MTAKTETRKTAKTVPTVSTATPAPLTVTPNERVLLDAVLLLSNTERAAIVVSATLIRLVQSGATPATVTRELIRKLRDNPELRTDPAHLATILRGMAQAFDGVGKGVASVG